MNKHELQREVQNIMRTLGTLSFETSVVQTDMYDLLADIVIEQIGDGGILRHRLAYQKHKLETALGHFNLLVDKFKRKHDYVNENKKKRITGLHVCRIAVYTAFLVLFVHLVLRNV